MSWACRSGWRIRQSYGGPGLRYAARTADDATTVLRNENINVRFADLSALPPLLDAARRRVERHLNQIVRVELHDESGPAPSPYELRDGENTFRSYVVFSDGMREPYPCYWRCFPRGSRDGTVVFGTERRSEVVVRRHPNHEQYMELSCWAKDPARTADPEIPFAGIGFTYN